MTVHAPHNNRIETIPVTTLAPPPAGHGRYAYSALPDRPVYDWPGGKRLAVYLALNLETFEFGDGLGAELAPGGPQPDVLNYAWRDWGNRVGAWRVRDMLDDLRMPASILVNSRIYRDCPGLIEAFRARGDEIVGHGRSNAERQGTLSEAEEHALIAEATAVLTREEGRAPAGWLGPWISQSRFTPDLLAEAGYRYLLDWCHDDQPTWFATRNGGRILSVPYPQELNDIPAIVARKDTGRAFAEAITDAFEEMLEQSRRAPLVMGIALHPYIVGQPHRLRPLRQALERIAGHRDTVWLTTAGAIAAHAAELAE
ncbi:polysaccharide deacetylase family protein [Methylorubrum extorquens]